MPDAFLCTWIRRCAVLFVGVLAVGIAPKVFACNPSDAVYFRAPTPPVLVTTVKALARHFSLTLVTDPKLMTDTEVPLLTGCGTLRELATSWLAAQALGLRQIDDTLVIFKQPLAISTPVSAPVAAPSFSPYTAPEELLVQGQGMTQDELLMPYIGRSDLVLSGAEISRMGMTDLASVLELASGVKIEQRRFAVIRGMGGRYQSVRMNGASLPSLGPEWEGVPLDVFPVSMLNYVDLRKSVYADVPGNATAGVLNIETRSRVTDDYVHLVSGVGLASDRNDAISGANSSTDSFGYDNGSRDLSGLLLTSAQQGGVESLSPEDRRLAAAQVTDFDMGVYQTPAGYDQLLSLNGGLSRTWGVSDWNLALALGYRRQWRNTEAAANWYGLKSVSDETSTDDTATAGAASDDSADDHGDEGILELNRRLTQQRSEQRVAANAMLGAGVILYDDQYLGFNWLTLRQSSQYAALGVSTAANVHDREGYAREVSRYWTEQQLIRRQVFGVHSLFVPRLTLNWQVAASKADYLQPNALDYRYKMDVNGSYKLTVQPDQLEARWASMMERDLDRSVALQYAFYALQGEGDIKVGYEDIQRHRDGYDLAFGFQSYGVVSRDRELLERPNPSDIFIPDYWLGEAAGDGFLLLDDVLTADDDQGLNGRFYAAQQNNKASFALLDFDWYHWELVYGVRRESNRSKADFWDREPQALQTLQEGRRHLPSWSLGYEDDVWHGQMSFSRTLVWPSLNELLPRRYSDPDLRIDVRGNPALTATDARNWNLLLHVNPLAQLNVGVQFFLKELDDAIEGVFQTSVDETLPYNNYTFSNADSGGVRGYELELNAQQVFSNQQELSLKLRYARIDSWVRDENMAVRPLQGQPEFITGVHLQYNFQHQTVVLFGKRSGSELTIVSSSSALPSVYLQPRTDLRFSYIYALADRAQASLSVDNVLRSKMHYDQGGESFLSYRPPRVYWLQLGLDF